MASRENSTVPQDPCIKPVDGRPGPRNLITDVPGLSIGNAQDERLRSGVTVLLPEHPAVAAVDVRGGAPGTRETDALGPLGSVEAVHGIVLSGGSAFGLSAATGVQGWLAERGIGFPVGTARVPIVPQAILFDLLNGGDKAWGASPPYEQLARFACDAAGARFAIGSAGAGYGATCATLKGGLGSASVVLGGGAIVGALVAVNPLGCVTIADSAHFWAAPFEQDDEFGGRQMPARLPEGALVPRFKGGASATHSLSNTTIAIVATDVMLTRAQAHRLAVMAQTGLARAIYPVHTPMDGDVVFAVSTGQRPFANQPGELATLGTHAANTLARAIARAVYEAHSFGAAWPSPPAYRDRFGQ